MWSRNTWDKFFSIFHSNLVNPKGLHDIWIRIKVGPERQVHFWYKWLSSCKVSGTESDYPNGGWASPSWAVNSLKSVKPSKDEFSLGCLNPFFLCSFAVIFSFPAYSYFLNILIFSVLLKNVPFLHPFFYQFFVRYFLYSQCDKGKFS